MPSIFSKDDERNVRPLAYAVNDALLIDHYGAISELVGDATVLVDSGSTS